MTSIHQPKPPHRRRLAESWKNLLGIALGLGVFFALAAILGSYFMEPITQVGKQAMERFGVPGLALAILLVDLLPTPLSYVPFMFLAIAGGMPVWEVLWISSVTSYTAGLMGFCLGRAIGMPESVERWVHERHPRVRALLDRYGGWGVAAIGILPFPLAIGTWSAGALKIRGPQVAIALLVRFPKTALYLWMIHSGFMVGTE